MKKIWYTLLVFSTLAIGVVGSAAANEETTSAAGTEDVIQVGFPIQPPV
ncbi:MAG TPA: hypothetical protein VEV44_05820 [Pseudoneobacillus sp.]|nr:hypothetical protein [Pseudoneobacillus sp.]